MTTDFTSQIHGIIPPVITPFDDAGRFDRESARRLYQFHLDAGVHGFFMFGSSSEGPLLSDEHRAASLEIVADVVQSRVPILAGVLAPGTAQAIRQAETARQLGADALVVSPPFYFPATPAEVQNHFRRIREAVDLPIVAYDIPVTTKVKIGLQTMLELARDQTIVGLKDSSGDLAGFRRLLARRPAGFKLLTGSELLVDSALAMGADGSVPGLANVDSRLFVELYDHWQAGNQAEAVRLQNQLVRLFDVFCQPDGTIRSGIAIGGMKSAMMLRGVISSNRLMEPFLPIAEDQLGHIRSILAEHSLLPD